MKAKVEATVCDLGDGRVATESFTWKQKDGNTITNDLCDEHFSMLTNRGHTPRRGYRPNSGLVSRSRNTITDEKAPVRRRRKPTKRKTTAKGKTAAKRRGRPPKAKEPKEAGLEAVA